ncbi:hypothetical protein H5410_021993 [Solanum commersonii]|uniref:Uncharacterized protein n=1 Tax=Solanum commersonii TaxID=4109 RepID=A0A9J5ZFV2_SOLCO|nr:hypothetical protein H5410_021993 [Solanum commersonii]
MWIGRMRTQEIAKQPLEIFNPRCQNDEGSSKTPLDATPSHLIVQDTLSPNVTLLTKAHNQVTLPKSGPTSKSSTTTYLMALKVEGHQKENKSRVQSSPSSWAKNKEVSKSSPTWDNSKGAKQDFKPNFDKAKPKMDYKDLGNKSKLETPSKIKWFKCQGYGHKENECPHSRTIIALNDGGYQTDDESKDDHREDDSSDEFMREGDGEEINDDGKLVLVIQPLVINTEGSSNRVPS